MYPQFKDGKIWCACGDSTPEPSGVCVDCQSTPSAQQFRRMKVEAAFVAWYAHHNGYSNEEAGLRQAFYAGKGCPLLYD